MNILRKLTLENLRKNRKRTIVTIIGVALSAALICAVAGMVGSAQASLIEYEKAANGDYHVLYHGVPSDTLHYAERNANVKDFFYMQEVGYAFFPESVSESKPYYYVSAYSEEALQRTGISLIQGRFPENDHEIVVTRSLLTTSTVEYQIGDTISMAVGTRVSEDGEVLCQWNPLLMEEQDDSDEGEDGEEDAADTGTAEGDEAAPAEDAENGQAETEGSGTERRIFEHLENTEDHTYTIVGIINWVPYESWSAPGYAVITRLSDEAVQAIRTADDPSVTADIAVTFKNARTFSNGASQISAAIAEAGGTQVLSYTNTELLRYEGAMSERTLNILYSLAAVIIVIILGTSVFVIRNSFGISVAEKEKQYGMLASIGATPRQIRKSVLYEGFLIGLIGIPLGIFIGVIAILVLIYVLNALLAADFGFNFVYTIPWWVFAVTVLISVLTIYLSCLIPAISAGKTAPVEAIRGNKTVRIRGGRLRTSALIQKLFGIGGVIADKNLKRSRGKYRTTVISLVVSIATFVALSSFVAYGKRQIKLDYGTLKYNLTIYGGSEDIYKEIIEEENLTSASIHWRMQGALSFEQYASDYSREERAENVRGYEAYDPEGAALYAESVMMPSVLILDKASFAAYLDSLGVKADPKEAAVICDTEYLKNEKGAAYTERYTSIQNGDRIHFAVTEEGGIGYGTEEDVADLPQFDATAFVAVEHPMGAENVYYSDGCIVISEEMVPEEVLESAYLAGLFAMADDPDTVEKHLTDKRTSENAYKTINVFNLSSSVQSEERMILVVEIFLYGFIIVISLIGVTNIFNTITTNMLLRSKEFAMLRSVGMTGTEFKRMIRLESVMYGSRSLLIGLPLGLLGSLIIYRIFAREAELGFIFPWIPIALSVLFVFAIVGLTMRYSLRKINGQNIIETIRSDNI